MNTDEISRHLSSTAEIIDEARNGRMFILVDDEDRENEGDLIVPAQMITAGAINFMATHGRGLICLALSRQRVEHLGLPPMGSGHGGKHGTAFTSSIEARNGVTTGISAADRARTILTAVDASCGPESISSPGHVFPLEARDGGVLVRAGHTEAAVDVARLAGLNPSGVICEIMNADGTMARLPELIAFARQHDLKIGTIRDLIAYRYRNHPIVERIDERPMQSIYGGEWMLLTYRNRIDGVLSFAIRKGLPDTSQPVLTRVHKTSIVADLLGQVGHTTSSLHDAMKQIGASGSGIIVLLPPYETSHYKSQCEGSDPSAEDEPKTFGLGAQILNDLGVRNIILMSNSPEKPSAGVAAYGLNICSCIPLSR